MHTAGEYRVSIDGTLHHTNATRLSGRRLRELAGLDPPEDYVLVLLAHNSTQSIGLEREIGLHVDSVTALRSFASDRIFEFTLDGHGFEWGEGNISEAELRVVAQVSRDHEIILEGPVPTGLAPDAIVDLKTRGVERLVTRRVQPSTVTILVNARRHEVAAGEISFETLISLAFDPIPAGPSVSFTVLYRKGPHERPEGSMVAGQAVHVREGEVFNVRYTDKS